MKQVFIYILLVFCLSGYSQIKDSVKMKMDSLSIEFSSSSEFASYLNHNIDNQLDRVGAIYYWVATHMVLDTKDYFSEKQHFVYNFKYKTQYEKEEKISKVNIDLAEDAFKTRKANYLGYVLLFQKLCNNLGVDCEVIEGSFLNTINNVGRKPLYMNFMWNAFSVNDRWYLVDILSGSGIVDEQTNTFTAQYREMFFMTDPDVFFLNHYPKDERWLLTNKSADDFASLPLYYSFFYDRSFTLLQPLTGVITQCKEGKIKMAFDCSGELESPVKIRYSFYSEQLPRMPKNIKGLSFEIPVKEIKKDYVTIYVNDNPLISFKVCP